MLQNLTWGKRLSAGYHVKESYNDLTILSYARTDLLKKDEFIFREYGQSEVHF